jgi:hypothetical protein
MFHRQALNQKAIDKAPGRKLTKLLVKPQAQYCINTLPPQSFHFLAETGQPRRRIHTAKEFLGLGLKNNHHRRQIVLFGLCFYLIQNRLVAAVHAVKVAHGSHTATRQRALARLRQRFQVSQAANQAHAKQTFLLVNIADQYDQWIVTINSCQE